MKLLNLKTLFAAAVVAGGVAFAGNAAQACDDYYAPVCTWKTVIVYETQQIPEVSWVTKYDSYNHPIQVKVVTYRTVRVPVEKLVKVCL